MRASVLQDIRSGPAGKSTLKSFRISKMRWCCGIELVEGYEEALRQGQGHDGFGIPARCRLRALVELGVLRVARNGGHSKLRRGYRTPTEIRP
jgi:hypothetical protein